jgi:Ca-activated chloride channel family protein
MTKPAGLVDQDGQQVALKSVHAEGRIEGLLATVSLRQTYINLGGNAIEAVYTFPLGWGAVLMGVDLELGGKRMNAMVLAKPEASEKYEDAMDNGDMPVMVEDSGNGLYTVNLGNLKSGEEAAITVRYAQLLRLEQGQVRFALPTTVAPRYGDPHAGGGLPVHATVDSSLEVSYPFTVQLDVFGTLAESDLASPSHAITNTVIEGGGRRVCLQRDGWLDRDFLLLLKGSGSGSHAVISPDKDGAYVLLASFQPRFESPEVRPVNLKILVDCSGSMAGDSIRQARSALQQVVLALRPEDSVSFGKFGSNSSFPIPALTPCTSANLARLGRELDALEADMGGTELEAALLKAMQSSSGTVDGGAEADVLLITDGAVWDIDRITLVAGRQNHRIFAIGVGSAPAEGLLRKLAEQTGGVCELVSPNESMDDAVLKTFRRIQGAAGSEAQIRWDTAPDWQSALPVRVYSDEMVHVFGRFSGIPETCPTLRFQSAGRSIELRVDSPTVTKDDTLSRMAASCQLQAETDDGNKLTLAVAYQLVCPLTSMFLVHERADVDKVKGLASLQQIKQMHAAGAMGVGSVFHSSPHFSFDSSASFSICASVGAGANLESWDRPQVLRATGPTPPAIFEEQIMGSVARLSSTSEAFSPGSLLAGFNRAVRSGLAIEHALRTETALLAPAARRQLRTVAARVGDYELVAALVLYTLHQRLSDGAYLEIEVEEALRDFIEQRRAAGSVGCESNLKDEISGMVDVLVELEWN